MTFIFAAVSAGAQTKSGARSVNPDRNAKQKGAENGVVTTETVQGFNMAKFSEQRTLFREKRIIPGTDSVITEESYIWLFPEAEKTQK